MLCELLNKETRLHEGATGRAEDVSDLSHGVERMSIPKFWCWTCLGLIQRPAKQNGAYWEHNLSRYGGFSRISIFSFSPASKDIAHHLS